MTSTTELQRILNEAQELISNIEKNYPVKTKKTTPCLFGSEFSVSYCY